LPTCGIRAMCAEEGPRVEEPQLNKENYPFEIQVVQDIRTQEK
jgi:hypothetical protein